MPCSSGQAPQQTETLLTFVTVGMTALTGRKKPRMGHAIQHRHRALFIIVHTQTVHEGNHESLPQCLSWQKKYSECNKGI